MEITKIIPPTQRRDYLSRPRLIEPFYDLIDYRLFLLSAPAGYGKTSLLIDLIDHIDLSVCWLSLDETDQDINRFVPHLAAAICHRFPEFEVHLPDTTHIDPLITPIINTIYKAIPEHFVLILDDYHLVDGNKLINHFMSRFVRRCSTNCHTIISTRSLLAFPDLLDLVAKGQAQGLSFDDLAFDPDDVKNLILQNHKQTISETEANELVELSSGWITGIQLSSDIQFRYPSRKLPKKFGGVGLYDYLAYQVLDQQEQHIRDFLIRTSLLEEFDADLCTQVFGPGNWQALINSVIQSNLFVLQVSAGTIRYHHLFRDFLQSRLTPEATANILTTLAHVHEQRQAWDLAYNIHRKLGSTWAIVRLIKSAGLNLVRTGQRSMLARWIDDLPPDEGLEPFLLGLRGYLHFATEQGDSERALALLNDAVSKSKEAKDQMRALAWRAHVFHMMGRFNEALEDADRVLAHTSSVDDIAAEVYRTRGNAFSDLGQPKQAIDNLKQALLGCADKNLEAILRLELGLIYMNTGQYQQAEEHYHSAMRHWTETKNLGSQVSLLNNLGYNCFLQGQYQQALTHYEQGLNLIERSGHYRIKALIFSSLGELYARLGADKAATDIFIEGLAIAGRFNYQFVIIHLKFLLTLSHYKDDPSQTRTWLASIQAAAEETGSSYYTGLYHYGMALLTAEVNYFCQAITHLAGSPVEQARCRLHLCLLLEDEAEIISQLRQMFSISIDSYHPLIIPEAETLLYRFRTHPELGSAVNRLHRTILAFKSQLISLRASIRNEATQSPFEAPKFRFNALGRPQVIVDSKVLGHSDWNSKVGRVLLFYLLGQRYPQSKEQIALTLWPDSPPQRLKTQFKNAMYQMRRVLGDIIIFDDDQSTYHFNEQIEYEYDVDLFQTAVQAGDLQGAMQLYRGDYLESMELEWLDIEIDWLTIERERLLMMYQEAAVKLAQSLLEQQAYEETLNIARQVLSRNRIYEEAHRLIMRAWAGLGNRGEVAKQFERLETTLNTELDTIPSEQTSQLFQTLMH